MKKMEQTAGKIDINLGRERRTPETAGGMTALGAGCLSVFGTLVVLLSVFVAFMASGGRGDVSEIKEMLIEDRARDEALERRVDAAERRAVAAEDKARELERKLESSGRDQAEALAVAVLQEHREALESAQKSAARANDQPK